MDGLKVVCRFGSGSVLLGWGGMPTELPRGGFVFGFGRFCGWTAEMQRKIRRCVLDMYMFCLTYCATGNQPFRKGCIVLHCSRVSVSEGSLIHPSLLSTVSGTVGGFGNRCASPADVPRVGKRARKIY
jgi:hypothetical protein